MIININDKNFGGPMRMGDIIGCANVVEHFRQLQNSPIKFYCHPSALQPTTYVQNFYSWMVLNTDYFSLSPGQIDLDWARVNLWDYRDIAGDLVKISNNSLQEKKLVLMPLFDADYNVYRNWPIKLYNEILSECETKYPDYDKVLVSKNLPAPNNWRVEHDLARTLDEIKSACVYIGGDTGLSHFVGALDKGPDPIYYYSSRGLLHTTPFNWYSHKKGQLRTYWLDFENTKW